MYQRTYWQDHVTDPSGVFNLTRNDDGTYTITRAGDVMQQGTPQDQSHFNNIEIGISDAHLALALLLNSQRQNAWEIEIGTVTLTNTGIYPFNSSAKSVALEAAKDSTSYVVLTEVQSFSGNVGEVEITDKLTNGFKIGYTGSAKSATIKYIVIGGYLK